VDLTQAECALRLGKAQAVASVCEAGKRRLDLVEFVLISRTVQVEVLDTLCRGPEPHTSVSIPLPQLTRSKVESRTSDHRSALRSILTVLEPESHPRQGPGCPGRTEPDEIRFFGSVGLAFQDLVVARLAD